MGKGRTAAREYWKQMPYPLEEAEAHCIVVDPEDLWVGTVWFDACWHGGNGLLRLEN